MMRIPNHMVGMGGYPNMYVPQQIPRLTFKIPKVVPDQAAKFEKDDLFKKLSRESEVRYTGHRDRPLEERRARLQACCREGRTEVAFVSTGTNLQLSFDPRLLSECDFTKEAGKVHLSSRIIMDGVCVRWRGSLDLEKLEGTGCLEFDKERAEEERARSQSMVMAMPPPSVMMMMQQQHQHHQQQQLHQFHHHQYQHQHRHLHPPGYNNNNNINNNNNNINLNINNNNGYPRYG